jgi:hypothetical protein
MTVFVLVFTLWSPSARGPIAYLGAASFKTETKCEEGKKAMIASFSKNAEKETQYIVRCVETEVAKE